MVYLKRIVDFKSKSKFLASLALLLFIAEVVDCTKIIYKKPIEGKAQLMKIKPVQLKTLQTESQTTKATATTTTTTSTTTTTTPLPVLERTSAITATPATTAPSMLDNMEVAESSHSAKTMEKPEEKKINPIESNDEVKAVEQQLEQKESTLDVNITSKTNSKELEETIEPIDIPELSQNNHENEHHIGEETLIPVEHSLSEDKLVSIIESNDLNDVAMNSTTENSNVLNTTPSKKPVPCTCGVFMTSQIKRTKNPYEPPKGQPVITNELDRTFPCTAVGQKQCQTKCLEAIVQHLPNSANILCATLDRDIRKERAYLYIKNCRDQWFNTNLAAGREYCCKDGQPYQCPLV